MTITIRDEELILDKERAIYLPQQQLLAISDLHLGKAAHFRKSGLQVPSTLAQGDLKRLSTLIEKYQPLTLLINGDMFHHDLNQGFFFGRIQNIAQCRWCIWDFGVYTFHMCHKSRQVFYRNHVFFGGED